MGLRRVDGDSDSNVEVGCCIYSSSNRIGTRSSPLGVVAVVRSKKVAPVTSLLFIYSSMSWSLQLITWQLGRFGGSES